MINFLISITNAILPQLPPEFLLFFFLRTGQLKIEIEITAENIFAFSWISWMMER
jgi:hypothetical protein